MTEERVKRIEADVRYDIQGADGWTTKTQSDCLRLVAEVRRLRAALHRYGHHESWPDGCRCSPCTCGLDEMLG